MNHHTPDRSIRRELGVRATPVTGAWSFGSRQDGRLTVGEGPRTG